MFAMIDQKRFNKLKLWSSDPNAYASLQPRLCYFDHELGYIAFRKVIFGHVVLGDPITKSENLVALLEAYLKIYPKSVFNYISQETAIALQVVCKKHINFMQIFSERFIEIPYTHTYSKAIQGALKKAKKGNLEVKEKNLSKLNHDEQVHLKKINDTFINESKVKREMGFISRSMSFSHEPDVRFFFIYSNSKIIGFCTLDPWYVNQNIYAYQLNQFRLGSTKLWGLYLSVVSFIIEILDKENIPQLCLGGCIDYEAKNLADLSTSKIWKMFRNPILKISDNFYGLTNLSKNKYEFVGVNKNRYLCAPYKLPITPLYMTARAFTQ